MYWYCIWYVCVLMLDVLVVLSAYVLLNIAILFHLHARSTSFRVSELCFNTNELELETEMGGDLGSTFWDCLSTWWLVVGTLAVRQSVRNHGLAVAGKPVSARAGSSQKLWLFVLNSITLKLWLSDSLILWSSHFLWISRSLDLLISSFTMNYKL